MSGMHLIPTFGSWAVLNHTTRMTKGQRTMVEAKIYPESQKGGRGKKSSKTEDFIIGGAHLSNAHTVLCYEVRAFAF